MDVRALRPTDLQDWLAFFEGPAFRDNRDGRNRTASGQPIRSILQLTAVTAPLTGQDTSSIIRHPMNWEPP